MGDRLGEIVVEGRFNGPPGSANGGYAAGRLAAFVDAGVVAVRLAAPPPLDVALSVMSAGEGVELRDGERVLATAAPGVLDVEVPPAVSVAEAAAATARSPMTVALHPFPTCFGCGPLREAGDALRHVCGPARDGVVACPATTDARLPHAGGHLRPEIVWAALDCPSAAGCVPVGAPAHVLGTFTVRIDRPVAVGEPHVCVAWSLGADGRKKHGASAILDAGGQVCAVARALWIEVRSP
jgi:hypothetical protein